MARKQKATQKQVDAAVKAELNAATDRLIEGTTAAPIEGEQVVAVIVDAPKTPAQKKGNSTVERPVAVTWAVCINACAAARADAKVPVPGRKVLVAAAIDAGVGYYTSRTQVQAFLKASNSGRTMPSKMPRDLTMQEQPAT